MPATHRSPLSTFSDALNLISSGTLDDKIGWIAERDPDWFVANVLARTLDMPESAARGIRLDEHLVDQAIAGIALRENVRMPLRDVG